MEDPGSEHAVGSAARRRFQTTRWSLVVAAQGEDAQGSRDALAAICEAYWYPLYAFVRRKGHNAEDALDLVQGFFERLLDKGDLASVERSKGRLRSFLMASCTHYLANRLDHDRAEAGRRARIVSIDGANAEGRYLLEPSHELTAERLFDRRWATMLLGTVMDRLEREMAEAGKARQFAALRPALREAPSGVFSPAPRPSWASRRRPPAPPRTRLRKRFRALIREEILTTVDDPADVDEEIQALFVALGS